jgi:hypothetical protein
VDWVELSRRVLGPFALEPCEEQQEDSPDSTRWSLELGLSSLLNCERSVSLLYKLLLWSTETKIQLSPMCFAPCVINRHWSLSLVLAQNSKPLGFLVW